MSCCTVSAPLTPMPPVMLLTKPVSTAPVVALTAARPTAGDAVDRGEPAADVDRGVGGGQRGRLRCWRWR